MLETLRGCTDPQVHNPLTGGKGTEGWRGNALVYMLCLLWAWLLTPGALSLCPQTGLSRSELGRFGSHCPVGPKKGEVARKAVAERERSCWLDLPWKCWSFRCWCSWTWGRPMGLSTGEATSPALWLAGAMPCPQS